MGGLLGDALGVRETLLWCVALSVPPLALLCRPAVLSIRRAPAEEPLAAGARPAGR